MVDLFVLACPYCESTDFVYVKPIKNILKKYKCLMPECGIEFDEPKLLVNPDRTSRYVCPVCAQPDYEEIEIIEKDKCEELAEIIDLIFIEIFKERERQQTLWGYEEDNKNTRNDWASYISYYVNKGAYNGKDNLYISKGFRKDLIKAAALCIAAIETIDRINQLSPTAIQAKENQDIKGRSEELVNKIFDKDNSKPNLV